MRNLLLNSILCVMLMGCSKTASPYMYLQKAPDAKNCIQDLKPKYSSVLYDTKVDVIGKHLSGLLLFKLMPDSSTRVVFSSEMGVGFFDFEYSDKGFKVHSCMKELNKKIVIKQLKKDIGLLFMYNCNPDDAKTFTGNDELHFGFIKLKEQTYYITDPLCTSIKRVEYATDNHKKVIVNMYGNKGVLPDSALLVHQNYNFTISLKQIIR